MPSHLDALFAHHHAQYRDPRQMTAAALFVTVYLALPVLAVIGAAAALVWFVTGRIASASPSSRRRGLLILLFFALGFVVAFVFLGSSALDLLR